MEKALATLVLVISTIILQAHSLSFWTDRFTLEGQQLWNTYQLTYIAILLSMAIEIIAIFAWLFRKYILATLASSIVILVPLAQISIPIIDNITKVQNKNVMLEITQTQIDKTLSMQDKLMKYNLRTYGTDLSSTNSKLDLLLQEKTDILNETMTSNIFIIFLEMAALLVVFYAQIISVNMLKYSKPKVKIQQKVNTSETPISRVPVAETPTETHKLVPSELLEKNKAVDPTTLFKSIEEYIQKHNISQGKFARDFDISPASISRLRKRVESNDVSAISDALLYNMNQKYIKRLGL